MKSRQFKVLITTSGTGSRLGDVTQFLNKALVRVGKKAAISYILDNIPIDVPVVITLGYKKEQVKEYLGLAHPERTFEFVEVDRFEGEGSSLAYSLLCAAPLIQCPFVYIACDTLFSIPISYPSRNWLGVAESPSSQAYTSVQIDEAGNIKTVLLKGATQYDFVYVGLAGIQDFKPFWKHLATLYYRYPNDKSLNDTRVFSRMLEESYFFEYKKAGNWLDIGNEQALQRARKQAPDYFDNLEKLDESIYLFDDFVIKFFHDPAIIKKRIARAHHLGSLVPKIEKEGVHFYRYSYVVGDLYSRVVNPENIRSLLKWCQHRLWNPVHLTPEKQKDFHQHCQHFYYKKSISRIAQFHKLTECSDKAHIINRQQIPSIADLFERIDWDDIFQGTPSGFHGDLHFENIIRNKESFCLLDWRQDFDGLIEYGDTYYDLAKLNHGMIVSHEIVRKNLFEIEIKGEEIHCDILRPDNLVVCQEEFYRFLSEANFNLHKVNILTALIFLNIAPLHHTPYNSFLYFFGKLRLWQALCSSQTEHLLSSPHAL